MPRHLASEAMLVYQRRMDVTEIRNRTTFIWDGEKAEQNFAKHGVSFYQAIEVFIDPYYELIDASTATESRLAAIGLDRESNLLWVVHVELLDDVIRIISARKATYRERRNYEDIE